MSHRGFDPNAGSLLLETTCAPLISDRLATARSAADHALKAGVPAVRAGDVERAALMALWEYQQGEPVDELCRVRCMRAPQWFIVEVESPHPLKVTYWSLGRRAQSRLSLLVEIADGLEVFGHGRVCRMLFGGMN